MQVIVNVIGKCKNKTTVVARQVHGGLLRGRDFADENGRWQRQRRRYGFCKKVLGGGGGGGGFATECLGNTSHMANRA